MLRLPMLVALDWISISERGRRARKSVLHNGIKDHGPWTATFSLSMGGVSPKSTNFHWIRILGMVLSSTMPIEESC